MSDLNANADLLLSPALRSIPLTSEYQVAFVPSGEGASDSIAVLNQSAYEILAAFNADWTACLPQWYQMWDQSLVDAILRDFLDLRFISSPDEIAPPLVEQRWMLTAWLHVTDRCNLRCAYCYLPHARVDMSAEVGRASIEAAFRSARANGYDEVKFKYAGGEPLLRFPFVAELHQYACQLADQHGISLKGVILSNGTLLTNDMVEEIKSLDLDLMISLDGMEEDHNCQRPYASGQGTFQEVIRGVELALAYGLIPDISITISNRNVGGLPNLLTWILARDLPFRFNLYRENDFSKSWADLQLEEETIIAGLQAAYKVIEAKLPNHSLLASLVDLANLATPHTHTCGVGHSYLVFDHKGQVAKCQMEIGKPVTTLDDPDPLSSIRLDRTGIINLPVQEKEGCKECEWRFWCTGGCPLHTYRATGRYDVKSPNCRIYKALYPEVVRLEGLRLLKTMGEAV